MATIHVHHVSVNGSPHRDSYDADDLYGTPAGLVIRGPVPADPEPYGGTLIPWAHVARIEGQIHSLNRIGECR